MGNVKSKQAGPSKKALTSCYKDCTSLVKERKCAPILVRLAWHDSGNYDRNARDGGACASIRFDKELAHGCNAGLDGAMGLIQPLKDKHPGLSYADIIQMASAAAIEASGGPKIPMRYGRVDAETDAAVPIEGRLPDGEAPFGQADGACPGDKSEDPDPAAHLRRVFYRMGFNDREIVALSGAHTIGRAYKERSGVPTLDSTKYTAEGPGTKGGMSWTRDWLDFNNDYFVALAAGEKDADLLEMSTDAVLLTDEGFKPHALKYSESQAAFFEDYAAAHKKLSEVGSTFDPPEGVSI